MNKSIKPHDEEYDVVVIGAGMGGLCCGAVLAKNGRKVKVFEKNSNPGGYCISFSRQGFLFSPLGFVVGCGPEGDVTEVLSELGLRGRVEFRKLEPYARVLFPGESFIIPAGLDQWASILVKDFPAEEKNIIKFFNTVKSIVEDMKRLPSRSPLVLKYQDRTLKEMMDEYMRTPRLKAVISSNFNGALPPSRFSALTWSVWTRGYLDEGSYLPVGGGQALAGLFVSGLEEFGGCLELKTGVRKILVENGRAIGVETTDGRKVRAGIVVSNAAATQTFGGLVGQRELAAVAPSFIGKLRGMERIMSAMVVWLGTDLDPKSLGITSVRNLVHESLDFEKEYEASGQGNLADSAFLLSIPSLLDPSLAPPQKHTIYLFAYVPYYLPGSEWSKKEKARLVDVLLKRAERVIPGLSRHIIVKDAATPRTLERYTLNTEGATSGWARTPENLFNRPEPKTPINNLYLTGHWTKHGGGVKGVVVSGYKVAKMIMSE